MKKNILITGASSDIGMAYLREHAEKIDSDKSQIVAIINKGNNQIAEISKLYANKNLKLTFIKADMSDYIEINQLIQDIKSIFEYPDIILHLAAPKLELIRATKFDPNSLIKDTNVQLVSIGLIMKAFIKKMSKTNTVSKVIFMLSSVTIGKPPKYMSQYTAVKYALLGYMNSLCVEFHDKPIIFNSISPSMINTKFLSKIPEKYIEMAALSNTSGSNAEVSDITPIIHFLISDDSNYLNGVNIPATKGN